ncbi:hypothetical protein A9K97_gp049 [Tokyovirus A1]|uniref:hypothetical protein n=1 Tax=Tokyovirus A1 TaxID=1826170 RepID=UPI0007A98068|nr:hypothetical protein A9K97_gp049 [Tokyovirus A1]BAU80302.1 hypothetical protein [Tokyovirus A1]
MSCEFSEQNAFSLLLQLPTELQEVKELCSSERDNHPQKEQAPFCSPTLDKLDQTILSCFYNLALESYTVDRQAFPEKIRLEKILSLDEEEPQNVPLNIKDEGTSPSKELLWEKKFGETQDNKFWEKVSDLWNKVD